jgi:N,N'-diacetyllegionaminate synthase
MPGLITFGESVIGPGNPVFVIAEIGTNFETPDEARAMIGASAEAGAQAIKLQTYRAETVATPGAMFTLEDGTRISQYDYFKQHEVSEAMHFALKEYAEELGLVFFSTPGHYDDVDLLERVGVDLYKTGSDDLTNYPFLRYIAEKGRPMIVSTGMCTLAEIEKAVATIKGAGNDQIVLLHCVVGYPAPPDVANLRVMDTLSRAFDVQVGLSDHFIGDLVAAIGVGLGAVALEKHLKYDRAGTGPDNDVACHVDDFKAYVDSVRLASTTLGSSTKSLLPTEEKWRDASRKSIVAARDIPKGAKVEWEMLTIKRPSSGLHPDKLDLVLGREARVDIAANEILSFDDLR